jgi:AcrR family transcriptional regulator
LEKRLLDAAWKLWQAGDNKLSLRGLARAARTNTPAIYRRFRTRKDIVRAMLLRLRLDLHEAMSSAPTIEDAVDAYIDFALSHPRQYEMFYAHQYEHLRRWLPGRSAKAEDKMPAFFWALRKLAEELGGPPERHIPLAITLWALAHGTASLIIAHAFEAELAPELRKECRRTVRTILASAN